VEVFFFGSSKAQLLGVYHPALPHADRLEGVVLCYPFGQEYMRAHRAFRQLAAALSRQGYHVLRFDYRGTGDSAGDLEQVVPAQWLEDIDHAIQELRDMAGISRVGLIGLRLGGLLAGHVACQRQDVSSLVLWDPLVSGNAYLQELSEYIASSPQGNSSSNFVNAQGGLHFNGFSMTQEFQAGLAALDLLQQECTGVSRILQVNSHETPDFDALKAAWQRDGYDYRLAPAPHDWNYVDNLGGILLPLPVLNAIGEWM
jgi:pimeloyl-ACP methyl ester carboxylesterase